MKNFSGITDNLDITTKKYVDDGLASKANLAGNNTFTGGQTITGANAGYSVNASGYVKGSWLQSSITDINGANGGHASNGTGRVCVFDGAGWIYYRTPAEILAEAGGAKASDIPTNYVTTNTAQDITAEKKFLNTLIVGAKDDGSTGFKVIQGDVAGGDILFTVNINGIDLDAHEHNIPLLIGGNAGTSGQVLTSQGAGNAPIWANVSGGSSDNSKHGYTQLTNEDLNTITEAGWYRAASGNTCTNRPSEISNNSFFLNVEKLDDTSVKQEVYVGLGYVSSYTRNGQSAYSGGTLDWSGWSSDMKISGFAQTFSGRKTFSSGINLTNSLQVEGSNGTSGQVLTSQGAGKAPIWGDIAKHGYTELTNEDLNTILTPGWYRAARNHSCKNIPIGSRNEFILIVESSSPNYIQQTFYVLGILSTYYIRYTNNGGTSWPGAGWYTYQLVGTDVQTFYGRKTFSNGITLNSSLQVNGSSGTAGQVLTSTGTGTPQWAFPSSSGGSVASVVDLTGSLIGGGAYFVFNNGEEGSFTGMIYCEYNTSAGDFEFEINNQIFSCTPTSQDITLRVTIDRFYNGYVYSYYYTIISNDGLINNSGFFTDTNSNMYISTSMGSSYAQGGVGTIIKKVL